MGEAEKPEGNNLNLNSNFKSSSVEFDSVEPVRLDGWLFGWLLQFYSFQILLRQGHKQILLKISNREVERESPPSKHAIKEICYTPLKFLCVTMTVCDCVCTQEYVCEFRCMYVC